MKTKGDKTRILTLILGVISVFWMLFFMYEITYDLYDFIFGNMGLVGLIGYVFLTVFHVSALVLIFSQIQQSRSLFSLKIMALILGVLSLFAFGIEKVLYDEIFHEFYLEDGRPGETSLLYVPFSINIIFIVLALFLAVKSREAQQKSVTRAQDEVVFTIAQYMGIISGFMGILFTIGLAGWQIPAGRLWIYLPFYALFLFPYLITVGYWLVIKRREKISDWYDEKQWRDILRASLTTLVVSIPGMAMLLLVEQPVMFYWFPYYIFLVILVFSSSTLFFFKMR